MYLKMWSFPEVINYYWQDMNEAAGIMRTEDRKRKANERGEKAKRMKKVRDYGKDGHFAAD